MSATTSAFLRATSPLAEAMAAASLLSVNPKDRDSLHNERRNTRSCALMGANTIEEVIAMIPLDYRDVLRDPLHGVAATVEKLCVARSTLTKWEKHKASGTYPTFVAAKPPTLVLSKEFSSSDSGADHQKAIADSHKEYLDLLLANAIKAKSDDVLFLMSSTDIKHIQNDLLPLVQARSLNSFRVQYSACLQGCSGRRVWRG